MLHTRFKRYSELSLEAFVSLIIGPKQATVVLHDLFLSFNMRFSGLTFYLKSKFPSYFYRSLYPPNLRCDISFRRNNLPVLTLPSISHHSLSTSLSTHHLSIPNPSFQTLRHRLRSSRCQSSLAMLAYYCLHLQKAPPTISSLSLSSTRTLTTEDNITIFFAMTLSIKLL